MQDLKKGLWGTVGYVKIASELLHEVSLSAVVRKNDPAHMSLVQTLKDHQ